MKMGGGGCVRVARGGGYGAREGGREAAVMAWFCRAICLSPLYPRLTPWATTCRPCRGSVSGAEAEGIERATDCLDLSLHRGSAGNFRVSTMHDARGTRILLCVLCSLRFNSFDYDYDYEHEHEHEHEHENFSVVFSAASASLRFNAFDYDCDFGYELP